MWAKRSCQKSKVHWTNKNKTKLIKSYTCNYMAIYVLLWTIATRLLSVFFYYDLNVLISPRKNYMQSVRFKENDQKQWWMTFKKLNWLSLYSQPSRIGAILIAHDLVKDTLWIEVQEKINTFPIFHIKFWGKIVY